MAVYEYTGEKPRDDTTNRPTNNSNPYLWSTLVTLAAADATTTTIALSVFNAPEANPLLATVIHATGPLAVFPMKLLYVAAAYACWRCVEPRGQTAVLTTGITLSALVVINNLVWLIGGGIQ